MKRTIAIFCLLLSLPIHALEVVFINPSMKGNDFWDQVNRVASAAANDLKISLKIIQSGGHRLLQKELVNKLIAQDSKPDYVIFMPYDGTAFESFTKLEQAKIPFVTLERTVFPDLQLKLGYPQEHFKFWLGEIYHNNKKAGRLLANALINASKKSLPVTNNLNVVGISGDMSGHSSERDSGLVEELEHDDDFSLAQIVNARWERRIASDMFIGLQRRYKDIEVVWSAADIMALGVADIANKHGKTINHNLFIGGFDWTTEALQAIKENRYTASVGGHFMQVAWALVKIYDYNKGKPAFTINNNAPSYLLQLIDRNNINGYHVLLNSPDWSNIDFREFSLSHQTDLSYYQFDFSIVLDKLNQ